MKNLTHKLVVIAVFSALTFSASAAESEYKTEKERFSYAVGVQMGNSLKQQGITNLDAKAVGQAIADVLAGSQLKVSQQDMQAAILAYNQKMAAERQAASAKKKAEGDKFRANNKKRKSVKELNSGVQYEVIKEGKGEKPKETDTVKVHYHGTLVDGTVFDSSVQRGVPAEFPVNRVIAGWTEILQLMPVGSKWKVVIPPQHAYGDKGAGPKIGPGETLVFDIELLEIKK
ncbi:MAG: FKBP-type peptidyl-prolyl cis-trans isomerase [Thioalkalispiraceae bacterium]